MFVIQKRIGTLREDKRNTGLPILQIEAGTETFPLVKSAPLHFYSSFLLSCEDRKVLEQFSCFECGWKQREQNVSRCSQVLRAAKLSLQSDHVRLFAFRSGKRVQI